MTNRFSPRPSRSSEQSDQRTAHAPRDRQPLDRTLTLSVQVKLIEADLADLQMVDGELTLMVDPIFELACQAARDGIADRDAGLQPVRWREAWPQQPAWPVADGPHDHRDRRSA